MSELLDKKERWFTEDVPFYEGKCPECKEQGVTSVLAIGDDSFFCENPNCLVIRHSSEGYYKITDDDIKLPDVDLVPSSLFKKRE